MCLLTIKQEICAKTYLFYFVLILGRCYFLIAFSRLLCASFSSSIIAILIGIVVVSLYLSRTSGSLSMAIHCKVKLYDFSLSV